MNWSDAIDGYCERTGPGLWSEPLNALTNVAFLLAALVMWRRTAGNRAPAETVLIALLAFIGVGSALFHTFAARWAAVVDVLPIGLFILAYIWAANRTFWAMPRWAAALGTAAFIPWAVLLEPVFAALPFFRVSAGYWPVALLIALYGVLLRGRAPATGRGLLVGAGVLTVSLAARSVDEAWCEAVPLGTHWLWHLLNGAMLGWMIEVHRKHRAAQSLSASRSSGVA